MTGPLECWTQADFLDCSFSVLRFRVLLFILWGILCIIFLLFLAALTFLLWYFIFIVIMFKRFCCGLVFTFSIILIIFNNYYFRLVYFLLLLLPDSKVPEHHGYADQHCVCEGEPGSHVVCLHHHLVHRPPLHVAALFSTPH